MSKNQVNLTITPLSIEEFISKYSIAGSPASAYYYYLIASQDVHSYGALDLEEWYRYQLDIYLTLKVA